MILVLPAYQQPSKHPCSTRPLLELSFDHAQDPSQDNYRYRQPLSLGPHRLMLRPRESRDLRLISSDVAVTPDAVVTGLMMSSAMRSRRPFSDPGRKSRDRQRHRLNTTPTAWPVFDVAASAVFYPFRYSDDDWIDLGALDDPAIPGSGRAVAGLARPSSGQSDGHACPA